MSEVPTVMGRFKIQIIRKSEVATSIQSNRHFRASLPDVTWSSGEFCVLSMAMCLLESVVFQIHSDDIRARFAGL